MMIEITTENCTSVLVNPNQVETIYMITGDTLDETKAQIIFTSGRWLWTSRKEALRVARWLDRTIPVEAFVRHEE